MEFHLTLTILWIGKQTEKYQMNFFVVLLILILIIGIRKSR